MRSVKAPVKDSPLAAFVASSNATQVGVMVRPWKAVIDKTVPTENVRACLAAVESGNVDAGIVYKTDALISKKVRVVFEVPLAEGPKISYPVALVKDGRRSVALMNWAYQRTPETTGKGGLQAVTDLRVALPGLGGVKSVRSLLHGRLPLENGSVRLPRLAEIDLLIIE